MTTDATWFRQQIARLPDDVPPRLISEYVQGRRVMPGDTPFPGLWDNARTPYLVEIQDDMSPYSPIQHSITMKARKLGMTAASENVVCYWLFANPTAVEYVTATDELAKSWAAQRLEPVINSMGYRGMLKGANENPKSRSTGDKTLSKQVPGGYLNIVSAQSMMALRAGDIRVLIRDEIDGVRAHLSLTGEGRWLEVNYAHTNSWGARRKVMDLSTPTTMELSEIYREYEKGDCRKFLVPCPLCGKEQELVHLADDAAHGIKAETKAGAFVRAYYLCEFCHEEIPETRKPDFLALGRWVATKASSNPVLRSRQIGSLYVPTGMVSWDEYMQTYREALGDPIAMESFTQLYMGLPYQPTGSRPDVRKVIAHRGGYPQATVPKGVIYLTMGVDVQRGSDRDPQTGQLKDPANPARLELEVLGTGKGFRTWSVDFRKFVGAVDDAFAGAWEEFAQWIESGLVYKRDDGAEFRVQKVFIDSGDNTHTVYAFCSGHGHWRHIHPSKGRPVIVAKAGERGDLQGPGKQEHKRMETLRIGAPNEILYEINTQHYKRTLYGALYSVQRQQVDPQPARFCDFPRDYPDEYFHQLVAEEELADRSFQPVHKGAPNEALDVRVMGMAAADAFLVYIVLGLQDAAVQKGALRRDAENQIRSPEALAWLERQIVVPPPKEAPKAS